MTAKSQNMKESTLLTEKKHIFELRTGSISHTRTNSASGSSSFGFSSIRPNERFLQSQLPPTAPLMMSRVTDVDTRAEKAEVVALGKLKDKIEFMRNRLKCIEVAKRRNRGRMETMKKKANEILAVRNVAEDMNRQKEEFREYQEEVKKDLHEKVGEAKVVKERGLQETRDELRHEKVTAGMRTKELKKETKEQRRAKEAENLQRGKEIIGLLKMNGSLAEARGEKSLFRDGPRSLRSITSKKDGLFAARDNGYMEEFEEYGLDEMQEELAKLMAEEQRRADELKKVERLEKQAEKDLISVAKSKIF